MTLHYHGTPITPMSVLFELAGKCFCVSHAKPQDVERVHQIGQSVMLDNGAFRKWRGGGDTDWTAYLQWTERWLAFPTTWAVIPDEIDAGADLQDELIRQWPFSIRGAPVWHMDEPIERLLRLCDEWPKVCLGSTSQYAEVLSAPWERRMDEAFEALTLRHRFLPWLHMLRGLNCCGRRWPFASADSADVARNHNRPQNGAKKMAESWDAVQCPSAWKSLGKQMELIE